MSHAIAVPLPSQSITPLAVYFEPTDHEGYSLELQFSGTFGHTFDVRLYGHPNRNRGRFDPRQCEYRDHNGASEPAVFTQFMTVLSASTNGVVEYRATAFGSALRDTLVVQKWNSRPRVVEFSADRRGVAGVRDDLIQDSELKGLDVTSGPGGALLSANYTSDRLEVIVPSDVSAVGLTPYDIFPWRAPAGASRSAGRASAPWPIPASRSAAIKPCSPPSAPTASWA